MKTVVKKSCSFFIIVCCALSLIWLAPPKEAEASDARGNIYAPDGTAGFLLYARHKTGDRMYKDGKLLAKNLDYELNYQIVRPVYYKNIGNMGATIQALLPFGDVKVNGASTSGLMDPTLILAIWPIADNENKFWVTFGEWITMPFGDYDNTGVSLGGNRWGFRSNLGIVKGWGKFYVDIEPGIEFYTKNDEFGADKVDQDMDPMFRVEGHISYDFTPQFRLGTGYYYEKGGEKSYRNNAGIKIKSDEKDNHAFDITAFIQLAPKHQILVQYVRDIEVENGFKTNMLGFRYFYVF
ncbi:transporter [Desulfococcaceae bacterium OttesenSCG-928-F15]|nr:transporter [Desulfococcaceae bacterium OttesenSCG-928-F15]